MKKLNNENKLYSIKDKSIGWDETLERSHQRLLKVIESIDAFVYVIDVNTYEILYVCGKSRDIFGDVEGKICWKVLQSGQKGPCDFCPIKKMFDSKGNSKGIYKWEFQNTKTGRWFDCQDNIIRWIDGRIAKIEIAIDITEKKLIQQKLIENEKKYRELYDSSFDAIMIIDPLKIKYISGNSAAIKLFGFENEKEFIKYGPVELSPKYQKNKIFSKKKAKEMINIALKKGSNSFEWTHMTKNKKLFDASVLLSRIELEGKKMVQATVRNITEQKRNEQKLIESKNKILYFLSIINLKI